METAAAQGFTRLALIGIPCQVYALRCIEASLGLDRLYVIGTPCSDNTTTERFHQFLELLSDTPDEIAPLFAGQLDRVRYAGRPQAFEACRADDRLDAGGMA